MKKLTIFIDPKKLEYAREKDYWMYVSLDTLMVLLVPYGFKGFHSFFCVPASHAQSLLDGTVTEEASQYSVADPYHYEPDTDMSLRKLASIVSGLSGRSATREYGRLWKAIPEGAGQYTKEDADTFTFRRSVRRIFAQKEIRAAERRAGLWGY